MGEVFEISVDMYEDLLKESEEILEQATSFKSIGKFHSFIVPKIWKDETFSDVTPSEWKAYSGFKFLELHACVDVQEFKPSLQKTYERRIQVNAAPWRKKNDAGEWETIPSDWEATFVPSLTEVTGVKDANKALKEVEGKYVCVIDVPQQPTKKQPEPKYTTCKFVKVYASREEAFADVGGGQPVKEVEYSQDVVNSVKMLSKSKSPSQIAAAIGTITEKDVNVILGSAK